MKTQTLRLNVKIDDETKKMLQELAEKENRTVSGYIKNFIRTEYAKNSSKNVRG
uniref:Ribbon-helix-helix protein CopG domain-containing protein n=1 Tax=uncultured prokaryote TaxID=198431 RepID=A0A0H5Q6N9_9ZZZZ|nr:hypothetical protein [uncultured prokaryote]